MCLGTIDENLLTHRFRKPVSVEIPRVIRNADQMRKAKKVPRRRCTLCRKWYRPHPSAAQTQKSCSSLECRRKRRRRLAKRRRSLDLHEYREDERERQRTCRQKRQEASGTNPPTAELSRAGLSLQLAELKEVILKIWDKNSKQSRASLHQELLLFLRDKCEKPGQSGTKTPPCHTPPSLG